MSKLLIDESPLIVLPSLARAIGLEEAIVLQQMHYKFRLRDPTVNEWLPCGVETLQEWCPFITERTMRRIVSSLKDKGLIEIAQRGTFDRTNWYRIRYEAIDDASGQSGRIDTANPAESDVAKPAASMRPNWPHLSCIDSFPEEEEDSKRLASLACTQAPKTSDGRRETRRSRNCPAEWEPTPEAIESIREECPSVDIAFETRRFKDYEFASGKTNWLATWRNWMRKAHEGQAKGNTVRPTRYAQLHAQAAAPPKPLNPALMAFMGGKADASN